MTVEITAFERSPDGGKGLARDTRVRWALEEIGLPYELLPVSLHRLEPSGILAEHPSLVAYVARGRARPAYQRAYDSQRLA